MTIESRTAAAGDAEASGETSATLLAAVLDGNVNTYMRERHKEEEAREAARRVKAARKGAARAVLLAKAKERGHKIGSASNRCKRCGVTREEASSTKCGAHSNEAATVFLRAAENHKARTKAARAAGRGAWKALRKHASKPQDSGKKKKEGGKS